MNIEGASPKNIIDYQYDDSVIDESEDFLSSGSSLSRRQDQQIKVVNPQNFPYKSKGGAVLYVQQQ